MPAIKNILVVGGTGFIGSHLIQRLILDKKYKIYITIRNKSNLWRIMPFVNKIKLINLDKTADLNSIFISNHIDTIVYLATSYIKKDPTKEEIEKMIDTNITFPTLLLNTAVRNNVKYFINAGSCAEYKQSKGKISEKSKIEPQNFYASSKLAFEEILKFHSNSFLLKAVTLKLFYPYGEKDNDNKVITHIFKNIKNKKRSLVTKGGQRLCFTYVEDITGAFVKALEFLHFGRSTLYEVFNIGNSKTTTLREIVTIIEKKLGRKIDVHFGAIPYQKNELMHLSCNYKKAYKKLKWYPQHDISDGLEKMYNYYINS